MSQSLSGAFKSIAQHTAANYASSEQKLALPIGQVFKLPQLTSRRIVRGVLLSGTAMTAAVMPIQFLGLLGSAILLRASYFEKTVNGMPPFPLALRHMSDILPY